MAGYQTREEILTVDDISFRIQTLKDKQQFWDPDGEAEALGISSATWSLFGALWPSARVLAHVISKRPVSDEQILELGCGVGLVSLVAHQRGMRVTASDYHPEAGVFVERNARLNNLEPVEFIRLDWTSPPTDLGRFDLILGSDVLYERWHPKQLLTFLETHLQPDGELIVADPRRGNLGKLNTGMEGQGLIPTELVVADPIRESAGFSGRVMSYTRPSHA